MDQVIFESETSTEIARRHPEARPRRRDPELRSHAGTSDPAGAAVRSSVPGRSRKRWPLLRDVHNRTRGERTHDRHGFGSRIPSVRPIIEKRESARVPDSVLERECGQSHGPFRLPRALTPESHRRRRTSTIRIADSASVEALTRRRRTW